MKRARFVLGLLAAFGGVACGKSTSNSIVVVTVKAAPAMPAVTQLKATLQNMGSFDTEYFPAANTGTAIAFDTAFALSLPKSRSGQLIITIDALDAQSNPVATGRKTVDIVVGGHTDVTVALGLVPSGDAGVPDTSAADVAGGGPDLPPDVASALDGAKDVRVEKDADTRTGSDTADAAFGAPDAGDASSTPCTVNGVTYQPGQSFTVSCVIYICVGGTSLTSVGTPCADAAGDSGDSGPLIKPDAATTADGPGPDVVVLPSTCGNSKLESSEACDDGNTASGDGCSNLCRVEPGYDCATVGKPCIKYVCGNGKLERGELCDCGNDPANLPSGCKAVNGLFYGDGKGCSKTCTKEPTCRDSSGKTQACTSACGDGNIDLGESCDDGNLFDGDGCSSTCAVESGFTCTTTTQMDTSTCQSGTGQCLELPIIYRDFQPENAISGGHPDFPFLGTRYGGSTKPTTICVANSAGPSKGNDSTARCWGIAASTLLNGKPQPGTTTTCACQFSDWNIVNSSRIQGGYTEATNDSPLSDGNGGYQGVLAGATANTVSTAGAYTGDLAGFTASNPAGPMWKGTVPAYKDANSFKQWFNDDSSVNKTFTGVLELPTIGTNLYQYASKAHLAQGGFFPLDALNPSQVTLCNLWPYWNHGDGSPFWTTCMGDQYLFPPRVVPSDCPNQGSLNAGCWVTGIPGVKHDSYFTDEARYYFAYDGSTGFTLSFFADDDLFVFINGILVLDLGGIHVQLPGKVTVTGNPGSAQITEGGCLDTAGNITGVTAGSTACSPTSGSAIPAATPDDFRNQTVSLGLETGKIYEIAIFGADRHPPESNFQITLSGFTTKRSVCTPGP